MLVYLLIPTIVTSFISLSFGTQQQKNYGQYVLSTKVQASPNHTTSTILFKLIVNPP